MKKSSILICAALAVTAVLLAGCPSPTATGTPRIALYDVTSGSTVINPGDSIAFGLATQLPLVKQTRSFRVDNTGSATLNLTGSGAKVLISGADASNYSIPTQPPTSIPAGGSVNFDIVLTATYNSSPPVTRNATIGIASDDASLASLSFNVTGSDKYS